MLEGLTEGTQGIHLAPALNVTKTFSMGAGMWLRGTVLAWHV